MNIQQHTKLTAFCADWQATKLPIEQTVLSQAKEVLETLDFPTSRVENWKYTRVAKIANKSFVISDDATLHALPKLPLSDAYNIVFVNGNYNANLSSQVFENGLTVQLIENASDAKAHIGQAVNLEKNVFAALNTVYATSGAYIKIDAKKVVEKPIQLVFVSTGNQHVANIRNVVVAEKFAQARISQVFVTDNATECFANVVSEYFLEDSSNITVDKIQNENETAFQVGLDYCKQPQNAMFTLNTITLSGALVRNDVFVDVNGENATTNLAGAYILKDNQHVDNHTRINHFTPHCNSHEKYKGVINDKATAVFNGMVYVHPHAQKIDSYQSNGNVLLSDTATIYSKPELEIYADDVKCSHGSTTGQLDEEAIYYLRARGISKDSARALMVSAFIGDVLESLDSEEIVDYVHAVLEERFGWVF